MICAVALLAAGVGCSHTTTGLRMTSERIAFVRNGATTRAEVVENLGPPLYEFESERTIGYTWETEGIGWEYSILGDYHEINQKRDRWYFFLRFDENNKVSRHGKARKLEAESLKEALARWLAEKTD